MEGGRERMGGGGGGENGRVREWRGGGGRGMKGGSEVGCG